MKLKWFMDLVISWIEDLGKKVWVLYSSLTQHSNTMKKSADVHRRIFRIIDYPWHTQGPQNMFNQLHKHMSLTFMVMEIMVVSSTSAFLGLVHDNGDHGGRLFFSLFGISSWQPSLGLPWISAQKDRRSLGKVYTGKSEVGSSRYWSMTNHLFRGSNMCYS